MTDHNQTPLDWSKELTERTQKVVQEFWARTAQDSKVAPRQIAGQFDPGGIGRAFMEMTQAMMANPAKMFESQMEFWQNYMQLWEATSRRMLGQEVEPVAVPAKGDKRFKDQQWSKSFVFDYIKQSYLLTAEWLMHNARDAAYADKHTREKVDFYMRQYVDAMAPTNFVATNPTVLKETIDTRGENLLRGLKHLLEDLEAGHGTLKIKQTDPAAFEVGRNIAVSPGKVVYRNQMMELICYEPLTEKQHEVPLVIIPPWINKYYILDLQPRNSFVKFANGRGHTVYVVSWVNPHEELANATFEDYMREGPLAALDAIAEDIGATEFNMIGYCLGGTLLASTLGHMAAIDDNRVKSATFFASFLDFSMPGEMGVFIDEEQIKAIEEMMERKGYLDSAQMAATFNMLRSNDLIWSFVVNNYLMGKEPFPFDLLYWNSDATRMPKAMHSFYLRKMYQQNLLAQPGGLTLLGTPIDIRRVAIPITIVATKEDHLVPWPSVYKGAGLYGGETNFILAMSGHIAGVINPPGEDGSPGKYGYWLNDELPEDPEAWLANAVEHKGSWWPLWQDWIGQYAGDEVPARVPGANGLAPLDDAPGTYVKM